MTPTITFWEWIELGVGFGYCDKPVCQTHEGVRLTEEEEAEMEEGFDPCIPVIRLRAESEGSDE